MWERTSGRFAHLLLLQIKGLGEIDLFEDKHLDRTQPLTFRLGTLRRSRIWTQSPSI